MFQIQITNGCAGLRYCNVELFRLKSLTFQCWYFANTLLPPRKRLSGLIFTTFQIKILSFFTYVNFSDQKVETILLFGPVFSPIALFMEMATNEIATRLRFSLEFCILFLTHDAKRFQPFFLDFIYFLSPSFHPPQTNRKPV